MNLDPRFPILDFAIALLIGALVGLDREKKRVAEGIEATSGIRTFILFALAGAVSAWLSSGQGSPWIFIAAALCVTAAILTGYVLQAREQPGSHGLTTEIAALVVFLLGGTTLFGYPALAVALAITTSAVLAYKQPLHRLAQRIGQEDLFAVLKLLVASFIVLPVLPNRPVDPWGALNPHRMWLLVIMISGLSLVGYLASHWLGEGRAIPLTGLIGGLASSTAVSLAFARRSGESHGDHVADPLAAGLLASWGVMFVRILIQVAIVNRALLLPLLLPMSVMGLISLGGAALVYRRSRKGAPTRSGSLSLTNPFSLTAALQFAAVFGAVLLAVRWVQGLSWQPGLYVVAALAGLTDVDAVTLSLAEQAGSAIPQTVAIRAITFSALTNTVSKCGLVVALGAPSLRKRIVPATAAVLLGGALALAAR